MAQAHITISKDKNADFTENEQFTSNSSNERKVNLHIDRSHHVSVFQNEEGHTVVCIRRGTRSVTVRKEILTQICNMKETIEQCCSFIET